MEIDILAVNTEINFAPENLIDEIAQNVRTICSTAKYSVCLTQDDELQNQVDEASNAILQTALNIRYFNEKIKADLAKERENRIFDDKALKNEIDTLAEGFVNDLLNLNEAINRGKEALKQKIESRIEHDKVVQEQVDTASEAILQNASNLAQER